MYVCMYVYTNPSTQAGNDTWLISRFEFIVFFLLDWLQKQGSMVQSALLFLITEGK